MLAATEVLLAATGNAVSLCPNYGLDARDTPQIQEITR